MRKKRNYQIEQWKYILAAGLYGCASMGEQANAATNAASAPAIETPATETQGIRQTSVVVKGTVSDANGTLPGVNIKVKGTSVGAVTDMDGNYSITLPNANAVLEFSYVGYKTQAVSVAGKRTIDVVLQEDSENLNEVVVVGYGVQKRASVTGSVASMTSKDLVTVKTPSVSNALVGKLPGLRSVQKNGAPGDDAAVFDIRGFGNALVIVDGVERDFKEIDANDIESISILKDASAAVYGFKGANGVLLITTKSGKIGKPQITYNGYVGLQQINRFPEYYNGYQYALLKNEGQLNEGNAATYTQEELDKFQQGIGTTDWYKEAIRKTAPVTYHNLSVSGGTEKVKYYFSLGMTGQSGIFRSGDFSYKQYNVRSNVSAEVAQGFTVDLQLAGRVDRRVKPYETTDKNLVDQILVMRRIQMSSPLIPVFANGNPNYYSYAGDGNPVQMSQIDEVGYDRRDRREFNGSITLDWQIPWVKGLSAKGLFSYDYSNLHTRLWDKAWKEYRYDEPTQTYVVSAQSPLSKLNTRMENYFKPSGQVSLNYANTFGHHDLNILALWEFYNDRQDWLSGYRQFTLSAIDQMGAGDATNQATDGTANLTAHAGLVGRVNYAYANKYLVEASFRYDGSYKFSPDSRWGFFPAVSLGWRISEEKFFKSALPVFDNLKIRGSYGKTGDEGDFSAFQYVNGYSYPNGSYVLGNDGLVKGAVSRGLANTMLSWYTSKTFNIGFEASAWKGLVSAEFDYYIRRRNGLKATRLESLPTTIGLSMPEENLNSDENKGFELVLGHHKQVGDFIYDIKANFTATRYFRRYQEAAAPTNQYNNWRSNGSYRTSGTQWGLVAIGQFQSYEDILNSPIQDDNGNKSLLPGDIKYQDLNNDGVIDSHDQQPIAYDKTPRFYYGLNFTGQYKGFDLTVFLQGAGGNDLFMTADFMSPFIQQGKGSGVTLWMDRWHRADPNDPESEWIPGEMPAIRASGATKNNTQFSTWMKVRATYLRLKTVELGYTFPSQWIQKAGINSLRIYANVFNALTFTSRKGLMKYMDPENQENSFRYYPQMRTYNFGVTVTF